MPLEMLIVVDQQDPVAHRDPKHREQAGERAERDDAAAGEETAHQRRGQGQEGERRQAPAPKGRLEEEEDPNQRGNDKGD